MATIKDIDLAYDTAYKNGAKEIALLYCISNYPAKNSDFNLRSIEFLKKRYKCKVGFSDHSIDNSVAKTALASGAEIFEKHIALKNVKAADYKFSLKGNELKDYTEELKKTSKLLGKFQFKHSSSQDNYKNYRRSIYALKAIKKGEKFSIRNISIVRPGYGLSPKYFKKIINKKSPYKIEKYSKVSKNIIKKNESISRMKIINYGGQSIDHRDEKSVLNVLKNKLLTTGPKVKLFEQNIKKFVESRYAISCNSGTSAIHLALLSLNLKEKSIVIMPCVNFISAYNLCKTMNLRIFFADVDSFYGTNYS